MKYIIIISLFATSCGFGYTIKSSNFKSYRGFNEINVAYILHYIDSIADTGEVSFTLYERNFIGRKFLLSVTDTIPEYYQAYDYKERKWNGKDFRFVQQFMAYHEIMNEDTLPTIVKKVDSLIINSYDIWAQGKYYWLFGYCDSIDISLSLVRDENRITLYSFIDSVDNITEEFRQYINESQGIASEAVEFMDYDDAIWAYREIPISDMSAISFDNAVKDVGNAVVTFGVDVEENAGMIYIEEEFFDDED
jgi:hypothetical protein